MYNIRRVFYRNKFCPIVGVLLEIKDNEISQLYGNMAAPNQSSTLKRELSAINEEPENADADETPSDLN